MGQLHQIWQVTRMHKLSTVSNDEVQGNGLNWSLWKWQRIEQSWWANNDHGNKPLQPLSQKQVKQWVGQNTASKSSWVFLYPQCSSVLKPILAISQETCLPVQPLTLLLPFKLFFKAYSLLVEFYSPLPHCKTSNTDALTLYIPHIIQAISLMITAWWSK